jgi:hypothetical protein
MDREVIELKLESLRRCSSASRRNVRPIRTRWVEILISRISSPSI